MVDGSTGRLSPSPAARASSLESSRHCSHLRKDCCCTCSNQLHVFPFEGGEYVPRSSVTILWDYTNLGMNYVRTKAFMAGVGNGHGLHKVATDIDRIIQLESGHEAYVFATQFVYSCIAGKLGRACCVQLFAILHCLLDCYLSFVEPFPTFSYSNHFPFSLVFEGNHSLVIYNNAHYRVLAQKEAVDNGGNKDKFLCQPAPGP
jgi:hypothetical protein